MLYRSLTTVFAALAICIVVMAKPPGDAEIDAHTYPLPRKLSNDRFQGILAQTGNVYIAGQPSLEDLMWAQRDEVEIVINLRTAREMSDRDIVPFDERSIVESLGMKYFHIPLGGEDTPYLPSEVDRFHSIVSVNADQKILLHCTVAWRASHMWAAWLSKYRGVPIDEAISHAQEVNFGPLPVEELLGRELEFSFVQE